MPPPTFEPLDTRGCWINGRTLRLVSSETGVTHPNGPFRPKDRVPVDPRAHADLLGAKLQNPIPFSTSQGLMATVRDFDGAAPSVYEFCQFRFTVSAFESSLHWLQVEDKKTGIEIEKLEVRGSALLAGTSREAYKFSQHTCKWGRGHRVWGNLERHYTQDALEKALREWFDRVGASDDDRDAIAGGLDIKGLGVSFASKHLRFLAPERYAVLDEVLSIGLGFALNPAGYAFFMHELRRFRRRYALPHSLARIEAGIFGLVRQSARGERVAEEQTA
ncbi:MAG: hypothetical protein QM772_02560 [Ottowia sp.]|uniref:hypothetical protein n=1 Tax=Ottowia sp. TaxID=1898956 RepID=UPI0039E61D87